MLEIYTILTGQSAGLISSVFRIPLIPLSWVYGLVVMARNYFYDRKILKSLNLDCGVISVGNIVAGGTGKTPIVIWLAKHFRNSGYRVAIILRGYKRKAKSETGIVSDGTNILLSSQESGDEAFMIALELPEIPVLVSKNRYKAGIEAISKWNTQVIILDDGFQHQQLKRDLDIVVIDSKRPFGNRYMLPAGILREPKHSLQRVDLLLLTHTNSTSNLSQTRKKIEAFSGQKTIFESQHHPTKLYKLDNSQDLSFESLKDQRILLVCGIGNPITLVHTVEEYQPRQLELMAFSDHHQYSKKDILRIQRKANIMKADIIITTQKDEQKLLLYANQLSIFVLAIEVRFLPEHGKSIKEMLNLYAQTCLPL